MVNRRGLSKDQRVIASSSGRTSTERPQRPRETRLTEDAQAHVTRRDVLIGAASAGAAMTVGAGAGQAQATPPAASGVVFELSAGARKGLAGVLVSNGRDVVATDADGRYVLAVDDGMVVFVIKPAGYMTPTDPVTRLPQFYHVHQPEGSPPALGLAYQGLEPTGALPPSIDFGLTPQDEPEQFEVILFTDPQPESEAEVDFIREDVVDALAGTVAKFGITAGDIMFDDLSLYGRLNRIIGTIGVPWYNVGGNHDLNFEAPGRRYSRETFKRVFGPPHYAFAYAGAVFLMLDDVDYLGADTSRPHQQGRYEGRLDAEQLAFVKALLEHVPDDKLIVIVMHIPLANYLDDKSAGDNLNNRQDFFRLFEGRRHTVSFSGHTHTTEHHYFGEADGWPSEVPHHHHILTAVSGSWWSGPLDHRGVAVADSRDGSPNGFHVLRVDRTSYSTRFVPAKEPNGRQVRISIDSRFHSAEREVKRDFRPGQLNASPVALAAVPATRIVANVFDGGPRTKVTVRIGSGEPIEMTRKPMPDPFVEDVFTRNDAVKKPWVKAEPSSHVWVARVPPRLGAGTHRLEVVAVTEYGDTVRGTAALEIVG